MDKAFRKLSAATLSIVINDLWNMAQPLKAEGCSIQDMQQYAEIITLINQLLFAYLEQYNLGNDLVPMCKQLLNRQDAVHFREFNIYNYNKLLLILKEE